MEDEKLERLRYPIGRFSAPLSVSSNEVNKWISDIEELPSLCRSILHDFTEEMLNDGYKPGGWTARQVIHHIPDSHMNAYIRFKLAMTEDNPVIRPYLEAKWAELHDCKYAAPEISLNLLEAIHKRWVLTLKNLNENDLKRTYFHPESKKEYSLGTALALYSWHGKHHLEHIRIVKRKFEAVNS